MNTVIITGSPRKDGYSERLARRFGQDAISCGEVQLFRAYEIYAKPCVGCGFCDKADRCVYGDLSSLHDALVRSDIIVFASPVYFCGFPAPLKAIIDRMQRYYSAKEGRFSPLKGKKRAAVLLSCGGAPHTSDKDLCAQLRWVLPALYADELFRASFSDTDRQGLPSGWEKSVDEVFNSARDFLHHKSFT